MSITGTPKFNSLVIATLEADFRKPTVTFTARAAFVNTNNGGTHGWTDASGSVWSKETMGKLKELRDAMEHDLARLHLDGTAPAKEARGLEVDSGLGEFVDDSGAQSV